MTRTIVAAPATTTLGQPTPLPTTGRGLPEAVLMACALAGWGNPMSGMDTQREFIERVISRVRSQYTVQEIVCWDQRGTMTATECRLRWKWARAVIRRHFADVEGVDTLPLALDEVASSDPPPR